MSGFSDYTQLKILDLVFSAQPFPPPAALYPALFSAAPSSAGGGTELTSGTAPGYSRPAVANDGTSFPAATGGSPATKSNGTVIAFPAATGDWPQAVAVGLFDSAVGGNLIAWATLVQAKIAYAGDVADFPAGSLVFTLT